MSRHLSLMQLRLWRLGLPLLALTACGTRDAAPPRVTITTPAAGSTVSGTTAVVVDAADDSGIARVQVYARAAGSTRSGVLLGSASEKPYVVSFATGTVPNGNALELYALATDTGGQTATSAPVPVQAQNAGAPRLNYFAAFTMPPKPAGTPQLLSVGPERALPSHTPWQATTAPGVRTLSAAPLATPAADATYTAEWAWPTVSGATGYRVYLSQTDLAGPYTLQYAQTAAATGSQAYSKELADVRPGTTLYGAIRALTGPSLLESPLSNADSATFLGTQEVASPADGQTVADGRPILTWNPLAGAEGYLYFLYDKTPWDETAKQVWTNYPDSTASRSATYPSTRAALPSGTYYWWVAGVKFDASGNAEAFSFSAPRKLVVP